MINPTAPSTGIDALVQLLGDPHGALGGKAQLARGFLLQGRSRERRGGIAFALLALDPGDAQSADRRFGRRAGFGQLGAGGGQQRPFHGVGPVAIGDAELSQFFAAIFGQPGAERLSRLGVIRFQRPILARLKTLDLLLALDDHPQRRRLHPASGQSGPDFLPQQRRQIETDQIVQRPPGLLGVDQIQRQRPGMGDGVLDRPLGDLVERYPPHRLVLEQVALAQDFVQVPGNGFALAIRIGGQIQRIGLGNRLGDGFDIPLVLFDELVFHREVAIRIDRALLGHQVAHVTVGREDLEVLAQIFFDRLRLGRRFHDDQVLAHDHDDGGWNRIGADKATGQSGRRRPLKSASAATIREKAKKVR